ncbi:MAG: hypothetical protein MR748_06295, partial [Clostridiales bacterium]|nr:hypothetical protein [Clostridiales bacterium]
PLRHQKLGLGALPSRWDWQNKILFFNKKRAEDQFRPQSVKKVEVPEARPPAGVFGAEPLTLVPQHFPRKPALRCLRATAANLGLFDRLRAEDHFRP